MCGVLQKVKRESLIRNDEPFISNDASLKRTDEPFIRSGASFIQTLPSFRWIDEPFIRTDASFIRIDASLIRTDDLLIWEGVLPKWGATYFGIRNSGKLKGVVSGNL
jgi:hypothetical protein